MIAEVSASNKGHATPTLSPEQVAILVLYGAARVRQQVKSLKNLQKSIALEEVSTEPDSDSVDEPQCHWLNEFEIPIPCTRDYHAREIVFHDLWRKGYYLTSGEQFGCSYLVYEGLPGEVHAKYLLDYVMEEEELSILNIISLVRVATQVKKVLLLAIVASDSNQPHYLTFNWFKPYSKEFE
ncbi:unnamed protein product [Strongylus vulgaris]|uniref:tRNA-intron lyase n=1 Tax=Strongylus vulgaris TaxID=40348 RepID=A0A3P7JF13_STRVU|nr:unnamed protein product [Strongylus vulgaris]